MRLTRSITLCLFLTLGAWSCAEEATPADACENATTVCTGNSNLEKVKSACESAATNAQQDTLDCIDNAKTCDVALACTTTSGT